MLKKQNLTGHLKTEFDWRHHSHLDVRRIRAELGYVVPVPLNEALTRTVNWTRSNPPGEVNPQALDYHAEDAVIEEYQNRLGKELVI